jgi:hypothetical protein
VSYTLDIGLMPVTKQLSLGDCFALGRADGAGPHGVRFQHGVRAIGAFFDEISVAHKNLPYGLRFRNKWCIGCLFIGSR